MELLVLNLSQWKIYSIIIDMSEIKMLLTEANGNLSDKKGGILNAVQKAEKYAFPRLNINWDIDLLVTNRIYDFIIPEDGVGGRTRTSDFIEFSINSEKATEDSMAEMIVHELCHAARWGKNDEWIKCLFDGLICEGIATYFEAEFAKDQKKKTVFIKTILERTDEENRKILNELRGQLDSNHYDYNAIFFDGNDRLPRWSGYSLGYYLVKKYLEKTNKKIEDAFVDKYADFKTIL